MNYQYYIFQDEIFSCGLGMGGDHCGPCTGVFQCAGDDGIQCGQVKKKINSMQIIEMFSSRFHPVKDLTATSQYNTNLGSR